MSDKTPAPPPLPWRKGVGEDYSCFVLEVQCCMTSDGQLHSNHSVQSAKDQDVMRSLPTMGEEQAAHSLFVEAMRRECFLVVLGRVSSDPEFAARYQACEGDEKRALEMEVAHQFAETMTRTLEKGAFNISRDILERLTKTMTTGP